MRSSGIEINIENYEQQTTRELEKALYLCESGRGIKDKAEANKLIPYLKAELIERYILEGRNSDDGTIRRNKAKNYAKV